MLCDDARGTAFHTWALLIKAARLGAKERNITSDLPQTLLRTFLQRTLTRMESDTDSETLGDAASGMSECLKNVGEGVLAGQEVLQLVEQLFIHLDKSFARSKKAEEEKAKLSAEVPKELEEDEAKELEEDEDEE